VYKRQVFGKATPLDHKTVNHAVENGACVETVFGVLLEVGGSFRGLVKVQLQFDIAEIGVQSDHFELPGSCSGTFRKIVMCLLALGSAKNLCFLGA
jgi:hypothetical protein